MTAWEPKQLLKPSNKKDKKIAVALAHETAVQNLCHTLVCFENIKMECVSCASITDKYKCSKCSVPYCSVNCYKEHKTQPQCMEIAAVKQATQPAENVTEEEPTIYAPFSTEDTVSLDKLKQLKNFEPLRQLLHNPHLRALLQQIDVAHNANLAMTAAMQEPLFVEFANACLQVVEPMTEAERAELELCS